MPTGPVIVLVGFALFAFSLFFAPKRGIISRLISNYKNNLAFKNNLKITIRR
jgi:manganese/zinc/iron transport system permease protein